MEDFEVGDYVIEWDDEKNKKNFIKHRIYFEDAAMIFLDDDRIEDYDESHSDFEDRYKTIGRVGKILAVIYTERGEKFRIISARYATKKEVNDYYGQFDS